MKQATGTMLLILVATIVVVGEVCMAQPVQIAPDAQCPICGMYPARYPSFNCQIVFKDRSYVAFDSATGLMLYLLFPEKVDAKLKPIKEIYFKEYFKGKWIEANKTYFVVASKAMGPMGIEFIAVDSEQAAQKLKETLKGKDVISYKEIDRRYMIKAAKSGWLHYLATNIVLK